MSLFKELNRRNVFRVAIAYVVASWVILQAGALLLDIFNAPESVMRVIVVLLALGFIFCISFTWAFEITPDGIKRESKIDRPVSQQTAKRLDILTMSLLVIAIAVLIMDRHFYSDSQPTISEAPPSPDSAGEVAEVAEQILEIGRLRDTGKFAAAFMLASRIEGSLPNTATVDALWNDISWATDIETEPAGARVYRQTMEASRDDWEELGISPLSGVRFALDEGYRLRFELSGYRTVDTLHSAVRDYRWGAKRIDSPPVKLDPLDALPEEMVRVQGFTHDLVDYDDFFVNRFEVTNREYREFVIAGGYDSPEYWQEPFKRDGEELTWEEAVAEFIDRTGRPGPATWTGGAYPDGQGDFPVGGLSWFEAAAYANFAGKDLPTIAHVQAARKYDLVDAGFTRGRSNFGGQGPRRVGDGRAMNAFGIFDLDGNVREWTQNKANSGARNTSGAAWTDPPFQAGGFVSVPAWDRRPSNGIRLIRTFDSEDKLARLQHPDVSVPRRDLLSEPPPSAQELEIYRRMFIYDQQALNEKIIAVDKFDHWDRVQVEFDAPYGERGGAYLYIPAEASPPYEVVLYWGGSNIMNLRSADGEYVEGFNFIVRSGRLVAQPMIKGSFGRSNPAQESTLSEIDSSPNFETGTGYRDLAVKWIQDVSRTIDYLESRDDVQPGSVGFYGLSFGAGAGLLALAIDSRIGPAVLNVGGLEDLWRDLPEVDPLTYVRDLQNPILMLNGEFDIVRPIETSQLPLFTLLGTDPQHKKHYVFPSGHIVPREATVRETLAWFDRYLSGHKSQLP